MAWTTPRTWAVNEQLTAALMNQHVRDNLSYLKSTIASIKDIHASGYANKGDAWSVTGSTYQAITDLSVQITTTVKCNLYVFHAGYAGGTNGAYVNIYINGEDPGDHIFVAMRAGIEQSYAFVYRKSSVAADTYIIQPYAREVVSGSTTKFFVVNGVYYTGQLIVLAVPV